MTDSTIRRMGVLGAALTAALVVTCPDAGAFQGKGGKGGGGGGGSGGGGGGGLPATPNIAYVDANGSEREIVLLDTFTGEKGFLGPQGALNLAWSPDGTQLAYRNASSEIRVVATDGVGADQFVTQTVGGNWDLDWTRAPAPNGRPMLVYGDGVGWNGHQLWVVAPDGTDKTLLAVGYEGPRWSPDGNYILAKELDDGLPASAIVVLTIGLDGLGQLAVTDIHPITMGNDNPIGATHWSYDWSNDGQSVVVLAIDAGATYDGDLWRVDPFNPSNAVRLTQNSAWEAYPGFGPQDQRIYFAADGIKGNNGDELWSIDAVTGGAWVLESGKKQGWVSVPRVRRNSP